MPPPSSRMTKQPERVGRFFPGKALAEDNPSSEEDSDEDEAEPARAPTKAPHPPTTSFPSQRNLAVDVAKPKPPVPPQSRPVLHQTSDAVTSAADDLEGFVTASETSSDDDDAATTARKQDRSSDDEDEEDASSSEEESSSDDEPAKPMLAPKFLSKAQRAQQQRQQQTTTGVTTTLSTEEQERENARQKAEKTDALLQAQLERDAAARAAGRRAWDDENPDVGGGAESDVDDTDGRDAEAERAAWKLRELKRVQRDRQALIEKEKEREEVERRRNMSAEEREREDQEFLDQQQEEREGKGKMAFMQKYYHKGAFFQGGEDEQDAEVKRVLERDLAGARFEDEAGDKAILPEYMRIRDMTRLGKKGRTKYRDLKNEDTGSWGQSGGKRRDFNGLDDRFQSDERRGYGDDRTGANAAPVGERRRRDDDGERGRDDKRARYD